MKDAEPLWDVWVRAKGTPWMRLFRDLPKPKATREMNDRRGRLSGTKWSDTTIIIRPAGEEPPA